MLSQFRAHQQTSIAAALCCQMCGRSVVMIDEILCAGCEVVEDILLVQEFARRMPALAIFRATAQIGLDENAALVKPQPTKRSQKPWRGANRKPAIAGDQRWFGPVELGAF